MGNIARIPTNEINKEPRLIEQAGALMRYEARISSVTKAYRKSRTPKSLMLKMTEPPIGGRGGCGGALWGLVWRRNKVNDL